MSAQNNEIYFACKKAFQEWNGEKETHPQLITKLKEIFTPAVQAEMEQQARIFNAQRPTEEAVNHAKEAMWKAENRP